MSAEYSEGWQTEIYPPLCLFLPIFSAFLLLIKTVLYWHANIGQEN